MRSTMLTLPMPGDHNVLNATAAVAVAKNSASRTTISATRSTSFTGVKRRFTRPATWNGVTIFDDYGHHPVEIAAVLKAARKALRTDVYRRDAAASLYATADLFEQFCTCFNDADSVDRGTGLCRPARRRSRASTARRWSKGCARAAIRRRSRSMRRSIAGMVAEMAQPGDYVICLGAGSITQWAYALPGELWPSFRRHRP